MTISARSPKIIYTYSGNGDYPFLFRIYQEAEVFITYKDPSGIMVSLIQDTDFTVVFDPGYQGGHCTLTYTPEVPGGQITIKRILPIIQETEWINNNPFNTEQLEHDLDRVVMILQQFQESMDSEILAFRWKSLWEVNYSYLVNDFILAPNSNIYICSGDHISSTWEADLANGFWSLVIDIIQVAEYATSAGISASNASQRASQAESSAITAGQYAATCAELYAAMSSCYDNFIDDLNQWTIDSDGALAQLAQGVADANSAADAAEQSAQNAQSAADQVIAAWDYEAINLQLNSDSDVVDVFVYDTSKDSDGGAWRSRCQNLSLYNEELNTAVRGEIRDFPSIMALVLKVDSLIIFDVSRADCKMWAVINATDESEDNPAFWHTSITATSISALNGQIYIGLLDPLDEYNPAGGLIVINFIMDKLGKYSNSTSFSGYTKGNIQERHDPTKVGFIPNTLFNILGSAVYDVATTIRDNAVFNPVTNLPHVTVGGTTDIGVFFLLTQISSIDHNVLHLSGGTNNSCRGIAFIDKHVYFGVENGATQSADIVICNIPETGDIAMEYIDFLDYVMHYSQDSIPAKWPGTVTGDAISQKSIGHYLGLTLIDSNYLTPEESSVAYLTNSWNSGWLPGDIQRAFLANTFSGSVSGTELDRSVKAQHLTVVGSNIVRSTVTLGAELSCYSGFTDTDYLVQSYSSDLDFGTEDFYLMGWMQINNITPSQKTILERVNSAGTGDFWGIDLYQSGEDHIFRFRQTQGASETLVETPVDPYLGQWVYFTIRRRLGNLVLRINDNFAHQDSAADLLTAPNAQNLYVGNNRVPNTPLTGADLTLLRIGKGSLSSKQISFIYRQERELFSPGVKCTLQSLSPRVNTTDYDKITNTTWVGGNSGGTSLNSLVAKPESIRVKSGDSIINIENSNYAEISATDRYIFHGTTSGSYLNSPVLFLREELKKPVFSEYNGKLRQYWDIYTQTVHTLPSVCQIHAVYVDGLLIAPIEKNPTGYTVTNDGANTYVTLFAAPTLEACILYYERTY